MYNFKVDFEKAYDSVSWAFLFYMLERLGFFDKWIGWIKACIESRFISILVNCRPSEELNLWRNWDKKTHLLFFLFLIVAYWLDGLMRQAVEKNLFENYLVGSLDVNVNLLQFADDTFFIGKPSIKKHHYPQNHAQMLWAVFQSKGELKQKQAWWYWHLEW